MELLFAQQPIQLDLEEETILAKVVTGLKLMNYESPLWVTLTGGTEPEVRTLASWTDKDGWRSGVFSIETPAAEFGAFKDFKHHWDTKRQGDRLPAWSDFQFEELEPWWGWLTVEDVVPSDTYDARYRLFGTHVVELFSADLTGKRYSELEGFLTQLDIEIAMKMVDERLIGVSSGSMQWRDRAHRIYSFIELPLADDGYTVDKFLTLLRLGEG